MIKTLNLHYDDKLILQMKKGSMSGVVATIVGQLVSVSLLYHYVPILYLLAWQFVGIIIISERFYLSKKLDKAVRTKNVNVKKYLNQLILCTTLTALMFGTLPLVTMFYSVPDVNFLMLGIIIIALAAGSISTLGSVYMAFFYFMAGSILPYTVILIYHGGLIFNIFVVVLWIFFIIHTLAGYRLFLIYKSSINLDKRFKTIYEKSSDGMAIIRNNVFIEYNDSLIEMFGYDNDADRFFKTPLYKLMPKYQPDGRVSIRKMADMLKKSNDKKITFEWLHIKRNGEAFLVDITLHTIELDQERVIHGVWRDISDRKASEAEIKQLNESLVQRVQSEVSRNRDKDKQLLAQSRQAQMGEMLSMIAHQWRQPLAAISSTSGGLELKAMLGKTDRENIIKSAKNISEYSQHLSQTINDFRDFFKPMKEQREVSFKEIVDSVMGIVRVSIENQNISIVRKIGTEEKFKTHPNELKQVILNLIKNAEDVLLEKRVEDAFIKIATYKEGDSYVLEVSDNGGGVSEELIENIFDPYFSTKLEKNGTGLGLYMSKTIIEDHCGGKLSVKNDSLGAIFRITLNSFDPLGVEHEHS